MVQYTRIPGFEGASVRCELQVSDHWFWRFQRRHKIALRARTHTTQQAPSELRESITSFHEELVRQRHRGVFSDKDIANMDQTPLPFVLDDGKTYDSQGAKEVWTASAAPGLDKRQCTVQLTVFADGAPRLKPMLIFRGKGTQNSKERARRIRQASHRKVSAQSMVRRSHHERVGGTGVGKWLHKPQHGRLDRKASNL